MLSKLNQHCLINWKYANFSLKTSYLIIILDQNSINVILTLNEYGKNLPELCIGQVCRRLIWKKKITRET